jgi:hypothetical protein
MGFWHLGRTRRRPYGRRPHSHPWVEDRAYWAKQYTPYWWLDAPYRALDRARERTWKPGDLDGLPPRTKAVAMPHGGERFVFRCPLCASWRQHLYNMAACAFACRGCLGLRYKSQYIGRRVDASKERIEQARAELERAEAAIAQQRKKEAALRSRLAASARLRRQQATWRGRRKRLERAENAYEWRRQEREMRELTRVAALCDLQLQRIQRLSARLEKHDVA